MARSTNHPTLPASSIIAKLREQIAIRGPISIAEYSDICLFERLDGYYVRDDPIGRDFTTAPEIFQVFGELLGIWCIQAWVSLGRPNSIVLVELGPGRGLLMSDILRTARLSPEFSDALKILLIEASPALTLKQRQTLANYENYNITWQRDISILPAMPLIVIANEFFDCLAIRQFVAVNQTWREKLITINDLNAFNFTYGGDDLSNLVPRQFRKAACGSIFEFSPSTATIASTIAGQMADHGGCGVIIDYGYQTTALGDSWQALKEHKYVDPLNHPGDCDLTAHVNFQYLGEAISSRQINCAKLLTQREFLLKMGILPRTDKLLANPANSSDEITAAVNRLIDDRQMGSLFKVLGFGSVQELFPFEYAG